MVTSHVKFLVFILAVSTFCLSCKKNETDPPPATRTDFPVSASLKTWGYFKKGSYWIYKDSVSASIDSVYVKNVTIVTSTTNTHNVENISVEFNDPSYNYALVSYPFDRLEKRAVINMIVFNPAYSSTTSAYGGGINNNYNVDTLKNVAGNTYADLRCIYYSYQYSSSTNTSYVWEIDRSYWKKGVGRVKKSVFPGTPANYRAKELLRYSVQQ